MVERYHELIKKYFLGYFRLSDELYDKETLTIKEIRRILGEREFKNHDSYESYLEIEKEDRKS